MADSIIINPSTGKGFEKAEESVKNFTQSISEFIKSVDITSESFDKSSDKAKLFAKQIQSAISEGFTPDEIADDLVGQLQTQLEKEGKNITIPNLVKQLSKAGVGKEITESISEWAKQRNLYVVGVKNLAEELGGQLMKPFDKLTGWIEKIPGGKLLHKMFGFDDVKKKIQQNITEKLAASVKEGSLSFSSLRSVGVSTFQSIGGAAKAAFAHPVLLAIALIIGALYVAYKQWNKLIDSAKVLRDETSLTADQALGLSKINSEIAEKYTSIGVDMEVLGKSTAALVNEFQTLDTITEGMQKNAGLMVGALGMAPDTAAKTLKLFRNMGVSTDEMQTNLTGAITGLAKAGGVAPAAVLKDMAESSKDIYIWFKGNLVNAARAAVELRRMGTSLKEAANTAKSLLDFESSITSELEASVLAGRQLDFSRARYLAFTGDLVGSQNAILDQVEKIKNFENMNVIQKEAIAKASGMELDQLENMLKQRKVLADMSWEEKKAYDESLKDLEEFRKGNKENLILENQRMLAQEKMAKTWDNLIYMLSSVLFPVFDAIYDIIDNIAKEMQKWFASTEGEETMKELKSAFSDISSVIKEISPVLIMILSTTIKVASGIIKAFVKPFIIAVNIVKDLINGDFTNALNKIPELVGSIFRWIYTAMSWPFQMIIKFIDKIFGTNLLGTFNNILDNIGKLFGDLFGDLISPFVKVYEIISNIFSGNIKEALTGVFDFIKSLWSRLFSILTFPFKRVLAIIDSVFGTNLKGIFTGIVDWVAGIFGTLHSLIIAPLLGIISLIIDGFTGLEEFLTGWWDKIYGAVIQPLVDVWDFLFGSDDKKEVDVNVKDKSKEVTTPPPTATGGIVTSKQVRTVGEAGPEAIIPLNRISEFSDNNNPIIVNKLDELINKIGNNSDIIKKLDTLITVIQTLNIKMDGKKVGEVISNATPQIGRA